MLGGGWLVQGLEVRTVTGEWVQAKPVRPQPLTAPLPTPRSSSSSTIVQHTHPPTITGLLQSLLLIASFLYIRVVLCATVGCAVQVPGCLIVNLGDLMQRWSGGLFRSTRHRVHSPSHHEGPRLSVAFCE